MPFFCTIIQNQITLDHFEIYILILTCVSQALFKLYRISLICEMAVRDIGFTYSLNIVFIVISLHNKPTYVAVHRRTAPMIIHSMVCVNRSVKK